MYRCAACYVQVNLLCSGTGMLVYYRYACCVRYACYVQVSLLCTDKLVMYRYACYVQVSLSCTGKLVACHVQVSLSCTGTGMLVIYR